MWRPTRNIELGPLTLCSQCRHLLQKSDALQLTIAACPVQRLRAATTTTRGSKFRLKVIFLK